MRVRGLSTRAKVDLRVMIDDHCVNGEPFLRACPNGAARKTREWVQLSGFTENHPLGVYNNDLRTVERAFVERYFLCNYGGVFRRPVRPRPGFYRSEDMARVRLDICAAMPRLPRLTRQQVVDRYVGPKRALYARAHSSLQKESVHRGDASLHSFAKFEKQDMTKAPRIINPRSPRYNLELGRFLKHAEKAYFRAINLAWGGRTSATVIKGLNADDSAKVLLEKWERFAEPVALGLDATKFDMHVSVDALKYEHSFYRDLFPGSRVLRELLKWQLTNTGTAYLPDGRLYFRMEGTRSSGDLNTSLGNSLLMCALLLAFARKHSFECELANNGDDCVLFMDRSNMEEFRCKVHTWFARAGFVVAVEDPAWLFEEIEFCQTKPVKLSTGWRMVRGLDACVRKDPMCLIPVPNDKVFKKWCGAVGECGGVLNAGVPVHEEFYRLFERNGVKATRGMIEHVFRGSSRMSQIVGLRKGHVSVGARVSYYLAFGVLPHEQRALEAHYARGSISPITSRVLHRCDLRVEPGLRFRTKSNEESEVSCDGGESD